MEGATSGEYPTSTQMASSAAGGGALPLDEHRRVSEAPDLDEEVWREGEHTELTEEVIVKELEEEELGAVAPASSAGAAVAVPFASAGGDSMKSKYGAPETPAAAAALVPPSTQGVVWHVQLVADDWHDANACLTSQTFSLKAVSSSVLPIKPRRPVPTVRVSEFASSLVKTEDGRWLFTGVLNGWPGLTALELRHVTHVEKHQGGRRPTRFFPLLMH